jgi:hypothetical protein
MIERIDFDYNNSEHIKAVCHLHALLLPDSLIPQLGNIFMSKFYYKKLPEDGLINVYLYKQDGVYIGFFSGTNFPFTFMEEGRKRHFLLLSFILLISILLKPSRIKIINKPAKITESSFLDDFKKEYGDKIAYFLSFGVLEEYRNLKDPLSKLKIPDLIMTHVFDHFKAQNKNHFMGIARKDNLKALLLYKKYDGVFYSNKNDESIYIKWEC